jgi:hypothetical protein
MPAPPVAKTDLRPWRSQIDALLGGIAMNPIVRAALLDSFEEHGLLAYTNTKPEIAVDELGRLNNASVLRKKLNELTPDEITALEARLGAAQETERTNPR